MIKGKQSFAIYFPNVDILMIKGKLFFAIYSSHARTPPGLNKNKWHGHVNRFCLIDAWISLKDRIAGFVVRCGFAALLILRVSGLKFLENVIKKRRRNSVNND